MPRMLSSSSIFLGFGRGAAVARGSEHGKGIWLVDVVMGDGLVGWMAGVGGANWRCGGECREASVELVAHWANRCRPACPNCLFYHSIFATPRRERVASGWLGLRRLCHTGVFAFQFFFAAMKPAWRTPRTGPGMPECELGGTTVCAARGAASGPVEAVSPENLTLMFFWPCFAVAEIVVVISLFSSRKA